MRKEADKTKTSFFKTDIGIIATTMALIAVLVLTAFMWYPPFRQKAYLPKSDEPFYVLHAHQNLISVNMADAAQLTVLPGIGATKAQAIVDYRDENGSFETMQQLLRVNGIGEKTVAELEGIICFCTF